MKTYILKAVADDTRYNILKQLQKGEVCACELPARVGKSQPAVSQHLKVLRDAGLAGMRKDGARRLYSLSGKGKKVLKDVSGLVK